LIKTIFWKEWKNYRKRFVVFLLAVTITPAIPTQFIPYRENMGGSSIFAFVWLLSALVAGSLFYEQKRAGALPFLLARPATKPFLFGVHYLSHLSILAALVIVSLGVHCIHVAFRFPETSWLDVLLRPDFLFAFVLVLATFSILIFIYTSSITFGPAKVGMAFLSMLALCFIFFKLYGDSMGSFLSDLPSLRTGEAPVASLLMLGCIAVVPATLSLWEISFYEIFDAGNRRWLSAVIAASALSVVLVVSMSVSIAGAMGMPSPAYFKEIIVTHGKEHTRILGVVSNDSREDWLVAIGGRLNLKKGRFLVGNDENRPILSVRNLGRKGRSFSYMPDRREKNLVYFSDKPLWGQEIRIVDLEHRNPPSKAISPKYYSDRENLGPPFPSPDGDRVAYLRTNASRLGGQTTQSLWITTTGYNPVSDYVVLPGDEGRAFEPIGWTPSGWTPIGWTPDGYDFMLRRTGPEGPEIWAVDWVATGARRFLEEFSDAIIAEDDLPKKGERISLVREEADHKWGLWVVNYRSGGSRKLGVFGKMPVRTMTPGGVLTYWAAERGLCLDTPGVRTCPDVPPILHMKWSPDMSGLACVTTDVSEGKPYLALIDTTDCTVTKLVEDFPSNKKQRAWLSRRAIVYADGAELWQVDTDGEQTFIASLD